jgi:hypothetical protein
MIEMNRKNFHQHKNGLIIPLACIFLLAVGSGVYLWFQYDKKRSPQDMDHQQSAKTFQSIPDEKVIDYNRIDDDENLQVLIKERKENFGLDKGVDIIVSAEESFKVGDSIIPMKEILNKIRIKRGYVIEEGLSDKPLGDALDMQDLYGKNDNSFGIYFVKPNDNFWNIHFRFLQEYFENKNIRLSPLADKPDNQGFSSGIGKILKFSENIVHIYNIRDRKMDVNLNLIHPENEIVIFHMAEILSLLDQIDLVNVDMIQFDGENLWISTES